MNRIGIVSVLAVALAAPLSGDSPDKNKAHGYALSGTVASVDEGHKTFVVKNSAGKGTTLVWTDATTVVGGQIKAGATVTLRYLNKDGKHIATSVSVGEQVAQKTPAPKPAATPPLNR
jgi:hypothetical protein